MRTRSTVQVLNALLISCLLPLMTFATIQEQIDAAVDGDVILIEPGTYIENINFNGKNVTVRSTGGPEVTIIDGNQNGTCVQLVSGENETAILDGFTITNGNGMQGVTAWIGGGLLIQNNSHPTLTNLIVTENTATIGSDPAGGGICIGTGSNPYLENIVVSNNTSGWGGGMSIYQCSPILHNVIISDNHATLTGGGIYIVDDANPELWRVQVTGNTADYYGGGIYVLANSTPIFNQVTMTENISVLGGGGIVTLANATPKIVNSIFWANVPDQILLFEYQDYESSTLVIANSNVMGGVSSIGLGDGELVDLGGNIDADPLLSDDFCLSGESPCIDTGIAFLSYNFEVIIDMAENEYFESAPDMGCYESVPPPAVITVPGDFTTIQAAIDVAVDLDTILVSAGTYIENINYDGKNIVVHSVEGPEATIIDGSQNGSCVQIVSGENESAVLDGFTLTNGTGYQGQTAWIGGGLVVTNESSPTLINLTVTGNTCTNGTDPAGGGISIGAGSNPYLEGIVITNNTSQWGGGLSIWDSSPTVHDVVISNNHATSGGGGIIIGQEADPVFSSVLVSGNTAILSAGGIFVHLNSSPRFNQLTVTENIGPYGGGGMLASNNGNPEIVNSIFWGNIPDQIYLYDDSVDLPNTMTVAHSDIMGGAAGIETTNGTLVWLDGNLDEDPWFCDPDDDVFTLADDSPCLGTGEDGVDMGALGLGCALPVALDNDYQFPTQLALHQNYPNPFNPSTTISYDLPGASWVSLVVYDVTGRTIANLVESELSAGYHQTAWNGKDNTGDPVSTGIYFCRMDAEGHNQTIKMLYVR